MHALKQRGSLFDPRVRTGSDTPSYATLQRPHKLNGHRNLEQVAFPLLYGPYLLT